MNNKNRARWQCHACNKVSYGSQKRAEDAMVTIEQHSNRTVRPQRAYPCPYGNGWHMTSQEERV